MKKLLILMLVLGVTSLASAYMQISVNGNPDPQETEYTLLPSETIMLDIYATNNDTGLVEGENFIIALIVDTSLGTVAGGMTFIPPAPPASFVMGTTTYNYIGGLDPGWAGMVYTIGDWVSGTTPYPDGVYFDEILFHCEDIGDAVVRLMEVDPVSFALTGVEYDSVVIHQPEPMTIALLGLGGLLLRRRK